MSCAAEVRVISPRDGVALVAGVKVLPVRLGRVRVALDRGSNIEASRPEAERDTPASGKQVQDSERPPRPHSDDFSAERDAGRSPRPAPDRAATSVWPDRLDR